MSWIGVDKKKEHLFAWENASVLHEFLFFFLVLCPWLGLKFRPVERWAPSFKFNFTSLKLIKSLQMLVSPIFPHSACCCMHAHTHAYNLAGARTAYMCALHFFSDLTVLHIFSISVCHSPLPSSVSFASFLSAPLTSALPAKLSAAALRPLSGLLASLGSVKRKWNYNWRATPGKHASMRYEKSLM